MICEIHESLVWSSFHRETNLPRMIGGRDWRGRFFRILETVEGSVLSVTWSRRLHSCQERRKGEARSVVVTSNVTGPPLPLSLPHAIFTVYIYIFFFFFLFLSISLDRAFTTHGFLNEEFIPFLLSTTSNKPPPRILPHGRSNEQSLEPGGEWKFMKSWIIRSVWGKRRIRWSTGRECWMEYRWKIQVFRGGANQSMGIKYSHDSRV